MPSWPAGTKWAHTDNEDGESDNGSEKPQIKLGEIDLRSLEKCTSQLPDLRGVNNQKSRHRGMKNYNPRLIITKEFVSLKDSAEDSMSCSFCLHTTCNWCATLQKAPRVQNQTYFWSLMGWNRFHWTDQHHVCDAGYIWATRTLLSLPLWKEDKMLYDPMDRDAPAPSAWLPPRGNSGCAPIRPMRDTSPFKGILQSGFHLPQALVY